jgi:nitrite reductase (NADH) small subunit
VTGMSACAKSEELELDDRETRSGTNDPEWTTACAYDRLLPGRGVGVLMSDGAQVALFRLADGALAAIGNVDPWSGAAVLSRGLVGDRAGRACVQSPIKKQAFAFDDGSCLDDTAVRVPVYRTRVTADGDVQVAAA